MKPSLTPIARTQRLARRNARVGNVTAAQERMVPRGCRRLFIALAFLALFPAFLRAELVPMANRVDVCGSIATDTTWTADRLYVVTCSVTVQPGVTLRIDPGTVVKLTFGDTSGGELTINGELEAIGTTDTPIVFTSLQDDEYGGDTNGDGESTTGQPGQWSAITFNAGSRGRIAHAIVRYGGGYYYHWSSKALVRSFGGDVVLDQVTLRGSWLYGLYATNAVSVTGSRIADNAASGLYYDGLGNGGALQITDNVFSGPAPGQIRFDGEPGPVTVEGNRIEGAPRGFSLWGVLRSALLWENDPSFVMTVSSNFEVAATGSLHLAPGSVVKLTFGDTSGGELIINGELEAVGTTDTPIVFTSLQDDEYGGDTNGDGESTTGQPGQWSAITFGAGSRGRIAHAIVRHGGGYYYHWSSKALIRNFSDDVSLENVELTQSLLYGVYAEHGPMLLRQCRITDNGAHGILNYTPEFVVDARRVWWGDASGPLHRAKNPDGTGNEVSDGVQFFPWAVDENGTVPTQVTVEGPSRVSPGETADYAISYYVAETLQDAVLVLDLPDPAVYREAENGGVYAQAQHQVFWRLGEPAAGTEGTVAASVRYPWGLPNDSGAPVMAWILASNLESELGFTFEDIESYMTDQPPVVTGTVTLTDGQIESERAACAELESLYQAAHFDGLVVAGAEKLSFGDGTSLGSLVMFKRDEARVLLWQGNDAWSYWVRPGKYGAGDASGGLSVDQSLVATFSGTWATAGGNGTDVVPALPAMSYGPCMRNCMLRDLQTTIQNGVLAVLLSARCSACWQGLKWACNDCKLALYEQGFDRRYAINGCHRNCQGAGAADYRCTDSAALCINSQESSFWNPRRHGSFAVFACDPVTGELRPERTVVCPDLHLCIQSEGEFGPGLLLFGEAASYIHTSKGGSAVCQRETVCTARDPDWHPGLRSAIRGGSGAAAPEQGGPAQGCGLVLTTVRVAHDPNEKAGASGDVVPGELLTYTVSFENEGAGRAFGVYVVDDLSPHLDESTLDLGGVGEFSPATHSILWDIGELAPKGEDGSKGERTFSIRVRSNLPSGTVITNQAIVYFPSVPEETATNTVVNVVQPLAAVPQSLETEYGNPISMTLTGRDVSGSPLTYAIQQPPLNGNLEGTPPNLIYTPAENFTGQDRFSFIADNGASQSRPADVTVVVNPSAADTIAPEIVWTYPEDGEVLEEVPTDPVATDGEGALYAPSVLVGFSEAMDPSTITGTTLGVRGNGGGDDIAVLVSWDGTANQAVLLPRAQWQDGEYTATVSTGVRDASGNPLVGEHSWSFRIGAAPRACTGNCNEDGNVTVDELIKGVNIALGSASISTCPAFDKNGDDIVTVDELVSGVNNALSGCAEPPPGTATASPSPTGSVAAATRTPTPTLTVASTPSRSATHTRTVTPTTSPSTTPQAPTRTVTITSAPSASATRTATRTITAAPPSTTPTRTSEPVVTSTATRSPSPGEPPTRTPPF